MKLKLLSTTLFLLALTFCQTPHNPQLITHNPKTPPSVLAQKDNPKFSLGELERRTFRWFWDLVDKNYQVPDRHPERNFSSVAATGFGLTTYCIGAERGYVTRAQAAERVLKTLEFLWNAPQGAAVAGMTGFHGFFYHFLDHENGQRFKNVELSSIDTGLLMAGVLSVQSYFDKNDPTEIAIRKIADDLYRRVEFDWFLNEKQNLSMGFYPEKLEKGKNPFLPAEWIGYNEAMILLVIAMASPTHPIPADAWERWCKPYHWATFYGQEHVNFEPLFGHQYSQMYIDFRGIQDAYMRSKGIDYFENARRATYANRAYCVANPKGYKNYGGNEWGLTACDGPADTLAELNGKKHEFFTYRARGAAAKQIVDDGTIAPTAAAGSLPFAPEICLPALENMWNKYYGSLVTEYGFKDAYNPNFTFGTATRSGTVTDTEGWLDRDYLGIDQGPIVIQIENHRSGFVWNLMKKNPYVVAGLKKAGFRGGWLDKVKN